MGVGGHRNASTALPREKELVPIVQEAGCFPGPVGGCGKSRPHRYSIPPAVQPVASRIACPTCLISLIGNTNYEAPHYAVFLVLVLLCLMS